MKRPGLWLILLFICATTGGSATAARERGLTYVYLPTVSKRPMTEVRGLWVTRFDWTNFGQPADPNRIATIVNDAAAAGFNTIYFQVRGSADAFYTPGLEPWAQRVSGGVVGQAPNPLWDPLAHFVTLAHDAGIALHAYLNVYPVWDNCATAPPATVPTHFYYLLQNAHGGVNGLQWTTSNTIHCSGYQRATPASVFADDHYVGIAQDLANRYDIDGIHLDHIRYGASHVSCDPVSEAAFGADCFSSAGYADWQRAQVNGTVNRFYEDVILANNDLWLSAAVWPVHINQWGWSVSQGYHDYYQDSKAWVAGGYIDSISPMIYPSSFNCPDNSFWNLNVWQTLVADFQASASGRYVIPGIGTGYCSFDEIANRIAAARSIGTAGHALFSYSGLKAGAYFDDLAAGPYATPALLPDIPWHP